MSVDGRVSCSTREVLIFPIRYVRMCPAAAILFRKPEVYYLQSNKSVNGRPSVWSSLLRWNLKSEQRLTISYQQDGTKSLKFRKIQIRGMCSSSDFHDESNLTTRCSSKRLQKTNKSKPQVGSSPSPYKKIRKPDSSALCPVVKSFIWQAEVIHLMFCSFTNILLILAVHAHTLAFSHLGTIKYINNGLVKSPKI